MIVACLKLGRLYCRFLYLPASRTISVHIGCRTELSDFCSLFFRPIWMWLSNWLTMWIFIIIQYYWNKLYYPFISDTSLLGIDLFINLNPVASAPVGSSPGIFCPKVECSWTESSRWCSTKPSRSLKSRLQVNFMRLNWVWTISLFLTGYRWEQSQACSLLKDQAVAWIMNITGLQQDSLGDEWINWGILWLYESSQKCHGCLFYWQERWGCWMYCTDIFSIGTDLIMCLAP